MNNQFTQPPVIWNESNEAFPPLRTLSWYIKRIQQKGGAISMRKLSVGIGVSNNAVSNWMKPGLDGRQKFSPSPETMVRIAEIAGVPVDLALVDLQYWKSIGTPMEITWAEIAKRTWKEFAQHIKPVIVVSVLALIFLIEGLQVNTAQASGAEISAPHHVYYGY